MRVQYPVSFVVNGDASLAVIGIPSASSTSRPLRDQIAPAHQVVRGGGEAKQPIDEAPATMPQFAEERHGLHPPEGLLDQFPFALADDITGVSHRAAVNGTAAGSLPRAGSRRP